MEPTALNRGRVYPERIAAAAHGRALLEHLSAAYPHSSPTEWSAHVAAGRVHLDGAPTTNPTTPLREGALLEYHRPAWPEPVAPRWLHVLHRGDGGLLICCKPSGLPTLPSEMFWDHTALAVLRRAGAADGAAAPTPVHRLGVGTSGVLLCAATPAARAALGTALQQRRITKTYRALASGLVQADAFEVDVPIGPVAHASYCGSVHAAVPGGGDGARPALSRVRLLRRDEAMNASLVEVEIPTGRPHQIRIHLAYAGHPLVGDPLYAAGGVPKAAAAVDDGSGGARPPLPRDTGYLLHAARVELEWGGAPLVVHAPPPKALSLEGEPTLEGMGDDPGVEVLDATERG